MPTFRIFYSYVSATSGDTVSDVHTTSLKSPVDASRAVMAKFKEDALHNVVYINKIKRVRS